MAPPTSTATDITLLAELKRRNVIRRAGLYLVGAWLLVQAWDPLRKDARFQAVLARQPNAAKAAPSTGYRATCLWSSIDSKVQSWEDSACA